MGRRRLLAIASIAVFAGALTFGAPTRTTAANPFTDISTSKFKTDIDWAYANGITVGCTPTTYCPKGRVTREQMATFLVRMFHLPTTSQDYFTDDETSKHELSINRLRAAGITFGCDTSRFCPQGLVTREQMASFIARAADLTVGAGRDYFWDDNGRTHEANIDRMAAAGMTSGCGSYQFCPTGLVTREQMAAFLHRVVAPRTSPPFPAPASPCDPSYPGVCIPPPPPDLDCPDISYRNFTVRAPDPHNFDGNHDGIGCEEN